MSMILNRKKSLLNVTFIGGETPQEKVVTPTTEEQVVQADEGYTCLSKVTINGVNSSIDENIQPENIKKDVNILGVTGTLESGGGAEIEEGEVTFATQTRAYSEPFLTGLKKAPRKVVFYRINTINPQNRPPQQTITGQIPFIDTGWEGSEYTHSVYSYITGDITKYYTQSSGVSRVLFENENLYFTIGSSSNIYWYKDTYKYILIY